MKKKIFKTLARMNKAVLPSSSKRKPDMANMGKIELAIFAWRLWVTKNALD